MYICYTCVSWCYVCVVKCFLGCVRGTPDLRYSQEGPKTLADLRSHQEGPTTSARGPFISYVVSRRHILNRFARHSAAMVKCKSHTKPWINTQVVFVLSWAVLFTRKHVCWSMDTSRVPRSTTPEMWALARRKHSACSPQVSAHVRPTDIAERVQELKDAIHEVPFERDYNDRGEQNWIKRTE